MQAGLRAVVALPVRVRNDLFSVVELYSDRPHPESEELLQVR